MSDEFYTYNKATKYVFIKSWDILKKDYLVCRTNYFR